jgi:outer membrane protein assembly factor BamB
MGGMRDTPVVQVMQVVDVASVAQRRKCDFSRSRRSGLGLALAACAGLGALAGEARAQSTWTHFSGNALRSGSAMRAGPIPADLQSPAWIVNADEAGRPIAFNGQSGPVVSREFVYALGAVRISGTTSHRVFAVDRRKGTVSWSSPVAPQYLTSFSSPAIDERNKTVIVASGNDVIALDMKTGAQKWKSELLLPVVNASPLVTSDLALRNRVFVTDFDGAEGGGNLYCINVDPFVTNINPYSPGDIVWIVPLSGTSGNTPAYYRRRVYVSTAGVYPVTRGEILAFDATARSAPAPIWRYENTLADGFFSGVTLNEDKGGLAVFAATYAFFGNKRSASLMKINAEDGTLLWSVPSNRTSATPIVLEDGRIVLSTGLRGFGTVPTTHVFRDQGASAVMSWDSCTNTWEDSDGDDIPDWGEYLVVGGWSHQPSLQKRADGTPILFVGALSGNQTSNIACTLLHAINLDRLSSPNRSEWLLATYTGAGSTPALADKNLYSFGPTGLFAFGPTPPRGDVNGDGAVDAEDIHAWGASQGERDVDYNGIIDDADLELLNELVRSEETMGATHGR